MSRIHITLLLILSTMLISCNKDDDKRGYSLSAISVDVEVESITTIKVIGTKIYKISIDQSIAIATGVGEQINIRGVKAGTTMLKVYIGEGTVLECKVVVRDAVDNNPDDDLSALNDASLRVVGEGFKLLLDDAGVLFGKSNQADVITYSVIELDKANRNFSFSIMKEIGNEKEVEINSLRSTEVESSQSSLKGEILKQDGQVVWLKIILPTQKSILCVFEK